LNDADDLLGMAPCDSAACSECAHRDYCTRDKRLHDPWSLDELKERGHQYTTEQADIGQLQAQSTSPEIERLTQQEDHRKWLDKYNSEMDEPQGTILRLHREGGKTHEEIAKLVNRSRRSVSAIVSRHTEIMIKQNRSSVNRAKTT
jgi:DNA-directed RNA polymerase specialized sigma24 family protein